MLRLQTVLILMLALSSLLPSCKEGEARAEADTTEAQKMAVANPRNQPEIKTLNVKVFKLVPSTLVEQVVANGVTRPMREITYSAEIPGKIEHLSADLGDKIKRGQVLARIDFRTLKAQTNQAQAAYDLARTTHERLASLKGEELVSQQKIDEAKSNMLSSAAALEISRANLAKSSIRASFKGIINAKYVEKGEYVGPGSRLYEAVDYRTVVVEARLAETQVASVTPDARVAVDIDALGQQFNGTIDSIIPTADKESKTFTLRVKIDNPNLKVLVGMSATLKISAKVHSDVIVASQSAVLDESGSSVVFIALDGVAKKRKVSLGAIEGDRVVLLEGIKQGEELIVLGQRDLIDGQSINIIR